MRGAADGTRIVILRLGYSEIGEFSEIVYLGRSRANFGAEAYHSSIDAGTLFACVRNIGAKGSALRRSAPHLDEGYSENVCPAFSCASPPRGIVKCIWACYITAFTGHPGFGEVVRRRELRGRKSSPAISLAISPAGR